MALMSTGKGQDGPASSSARRYFLKRITSIPSQSFSSLNRACSGSISLQLNTFAALMA
ncbi:hypothetical protein NT01EI_0876 [Edwardsiella ictaluri 93-146]|uniref:Uncharacterized protein n=1 Tax=Edwardsiella ictaluri (strain 93-146) TaxID=634503 RepID=C5B7U6_EDWI9|nr:hypothetical protein NT01EI_0876 [Edwardsiella ictaluri 93-146]